MKNRNNITISRMEITVNIWEDPRVEAAASDSGDFHPSQSMPFSVPSLYVLPSDNA